MNIWNHHPVTVTTRNYYMFSRGSQPKLLHLSWLRPGLGTTLNTTICYIPEVYIIITLPETNQQFSNFLPLNITGFLEASAFLLWPYLAYFSTGERKNLSGFKGGETFHPNFWLPRHRLTHQGQQLWWSLPDDTATRLAEAFGKVDVPRSQVPWQ